MNKEMLSSKVRKIATFAGACVVALCISSTVRAQANSRGESFYIVSSVNFQKQEIVLMRPTQLTVVAAIGPQTTFLGENGQKMPLKDLKAGDTVWAVVKTAKDGTPTVRSIREGAMTQSELHKLYLKTPQVSLAPLTPPPQRGALQSQPNLPPGARPNPMQASPMRPMQHKGPGEHLYAHGTRGTHL